MSEKVKIVLVSIAGLLACGAVVAIAFHNLNRADLSTGFQIYYAMGLFGAPVVAGAILYYMIALLRD